MNKNCTVYKTLDIIAKRWSLLIILSIYKGTGNKTRYSNIKKNLVQITPKILSARLKELEKEGIIKKEMDARSIPVKTYYSLTLSGIELVKLIQKFKEWGIKWKFRNKQCEFTLCKQCQL
jgi:DNA-binding HxlR family transcriptional regulator